MEFEIDNIKFNLNEKYNKVMFWDLYRIYIENKLGYHNINPKILKEIKKWLENPKGTDKHFDIDGKVPFSIYFHDDKLLIKKLGNNLKFIGGSYISFNNCEVILNRNEKTEEKNDFNTKENYVINDVEGYDYYALHRKDCNKIECLLETHHSDALEIIIETESIDVIEDINESFKELLLNKGWKYEERVWNYMNFSEEYEVYGAIFNKYFEFTHDIGLWDEFVIRTNKFEGENSIILTDLDIIKLGLDKQFDLNKYIPMIKSKNDNHYFIFDKKTGKVISKINNDEKIIADSISEFKLKVIKDEIEI